MICVYTAAYKERGFELYPDFSPIIATSVQSRGGLSEIFVNDLSISVNLPLLFVRNAALLPFPTREGVGG
jgi:hypothetical protein